MSNFSEKASFIWQVADDILRGTFKRHEYGDIILPFVVLRRLDCTLEPTKDAVIEAYEKYKDQLDDLDPVLLLASGNLKFYNTSFYDLRRLAQAPKSIKQNFNNYRNGFSKQVEEILDNFMLDKFIDRLDKNNLLFMMVEKFTEIDLHPDVVKNYEMGQIFEELLRRFSELSNETAGEHYTPRDVVRLMVSLLFAEHKKKLTRKDLIRSIYDPACGTGGMLTIAKEYIHENINKDIKLHLHGQETNEQTYAVSKSDMLITGGNPDNIRYGSSFSKDQFRNDTFHFMLSNPPYGVSWKKEKEFIENEAKDPKGRFSVGTPRSSDGQLLFLQHMISKMKDTKDGGSRIAVILNGSPLFTGDAGSGESNIRRWIIENDWLEAIIALPDQLFFNTGINTYIWIVTNNKPKKRKGKIQLINGVDFHVKMRKSLGDKRHQISEENKNGIVKLYLDYAEGEKCKIFDNNDFGFTKVTVERPLIENGKQVKDKKGNIKLDSSLRDYEKIPLKGNIDKYLKTEVLPHVPDAWMDREKDKIGYEINFNRYFYKHILPRNIEEIHKEIIKKKEEISKLLTELLS